MYASVEKLTVEIRRKLKWDKVLDEYAEYLHAQDAGTSRDESRNLLSVAADLQLAINGLRSVDPDGAAGFEKRLGWTVETAHLVDNEESAS